MKLGDVQLGVEYALTFIFKGIDAGLTPAECFRVRADALEQHTDGRRRVLVTVIERPAGAAAGLRDVRADGRALVRPTWFAGTWEELIGAHEARQAHERLARRVADDLQAALTGAGAATLAVRPDPRARDGAPQLLIDAKDAPLGVLSAFAQIWPSIDAGPLLFALTVPSARSMQLAAHLGHAGGPLPALEQFCAHVGTALESSRRQRFFCSADVDQVRVLVAALGGFADVAAHLDLCVTIEQARKLTDAADSIRV